MTALVFSAALFGAGWCVGCYEGRSSWLAQAQRWGMWVTSAAQDDPAGTVSRFAPIAADAPEEASVLFVGDLLPVQDRDYFTYTRELIASADFAIGNLESPLSSHGDPTPLKLDERRRVVHNEFIFRCPPTQAKRMAEAGFDGMTLANNHIMDYGGQALLETLDNLHDAGIRHTGAGPDKTAAREPLIARVEGQTIAVLAYVSTRTLPGTEHFAATDQLAGTVFVGGNADGTPTKNTCLMLHNDIRAARKSADFIVVAFHWGTEARDTPDALPRGLARTCIDVGADMIVGHHPHKLQGIEIYNGSPIIYSIGNFAFPTSWESNHYSAALELTLVEGRWKRITLYPVKLRFRAGDPAPAQGTDLRKIVDRVTRLSAQLGTTAALEGADGAHRIVIQNRAASGPRTDLLKAEQDDFRVEPHPELDGMSIVHFLAWDLGDDGKHARRWNVAMATALAPEIMDVLQEIYLSPERFPIHDVVGYNYRTVAGGRGLSSHALGRAIDINRAENPMIQAGHKIVHPDEPPYEPGEWRPRQDPYSITPDGPVVRAFKRRGWRWGGDWTSCRDYQHFDKPASQDRS